MTTYPHQLSGIPTVEQFNDVAIWLYELILFQRNTFDDPPTMSDLINLTGFDRSFLRGLLTILVGCNWIAYDLSQAHCPLVITRVTDVRHDPATVATVFQRLAKPNAPEPIEPTVSTENNRRRIKDSIRRFGKTW